MTLLFAGHDTTTSTVASCSTSSRATRRRRRLLAERDAASAPPAERPIAGGLPRLEMALDETLRLYPPAWVGPRRAVEPSSSPAHVPAGAPSTTARGPATGCPTCGTSPRRSGPSASRPRPSAALPKGAYVPFGGGSRTCIGMRFGQLEIRAIAARILRGAPARAEPGQRLEIRQTPTLGPRSRGMPSGRRVMRYMILAEQLLLLLLDDESGK